MNSFKHFKFLLSLLNASLLLLLMFLTGCQSNPSIDITELDNHKPDDETIEESTTRGTSEDGVEFSKIALVVGNNDYENSSLSNPIKDAKQVYESLKKIGFKVQLKTDLNRQKMDEALNEFYEKLRDEPGSMGLLYYAGHGTQADNENYLIPIDNQQIHQQIDLAYNAIPLSQIHSNMNNAKTYFNVLILDACRDNPYKAAERSLSRGLAKQTLSTPGKTRGLGGRENIGSILAFSTANGDVASDDIGYANELSKMLITANRTGMRIDDMFMELRNTIHKKSDGKQEPWYNASLAKIVRLGEVPKPQVHEPPSEPPPEENNANHKNCKELLEQWERGIIPLTKKEEGILFNQCLSS